ncbi:MAG: FAD-binding protein [Acidobacteriota bacterium]
MTLEAERVGDVQAALRTQPAVRVRGGGTKSSPLATSETCTLSLARLTGVTDYSPAEGVVSALAGTPVSVLAAALASHRQWLPFDPPLVRAGATIGGTVAAGVSGPGRCRYGGVRDFIVGATVVDGRGTVIRSGGKVVKNAAGFLLHHGIVGSRGALGVIVEVTCKVFPLPQTRATVRVEAGSLDGVREVLTLVTAARFELEAFDFDASGRAWLRIGGGAEALPARTARLQRTLGVPADVLEGPADLDIWEAAREFHWADPDANLIKVPVTPAVLHPVARCGEVRFSGGGSAAWICSKTDLSELSSRLSEHGLRGEVIRGTHAGARLGAFPLDTFERRVRHAIDPGNVLRAASNSSR